MSSRAFAEGAARAALGPELPPFYTADDALADQIAAAATAQGLPVAPKVVETAARLAQAVRTARAGQPAVQA